VTISISRKTLLHEVNSLPNQSQLLKTLLDILVGHFGRGIGPLRCLDVHRTAWNPWYQCPKGPKPNAQPVGPAGADTKILTQV